MSGVGPGWYADPERPGGSRYWDGQAWGAPSGPPGGGYGAPASAPPPGGFGAPIGGFGAPAPKTDGLAIAALVLSIFGVLLISVILAFVSRGRIKRSGGALTGKGLTTAALVVAGLYIVALGGLVALVATGVLEQENADDYTGVEREVAVVVDRLEADPASEICGSLLTADLRQRLGGAACATNLGLGDGLRAEIDITALTVTGDTATATVTESGDTLRFRFVKVDGEWRIDDIA